MSLRSWSIVHVNFHRKQFNFRAHPNQIFFWLIWHQMEFCLVPNQSEKCKCNLNMVSFYKIQNRVPCVYNVYIIQIHYSQLLRVILLSIMNCLHYLLFRFNSSVSMNCFHYLLFYCNSGEGNSLPRNEIIPRTENELSRNGITSNTTHGRFGFRCLQMFFFDILPWITIIGSAYFQTLYVIRKLEIRKIWIFLLKLNVAPHRVKLTSMSISSLNESFLTQV